MNFHKIFVMVEQSILTGCVVNRLNISLLHMQGHLDCLCLILRGLTTCLSLVGFSELLILAAI